MTRLMPEVGDRCKDDRGTVTDIVRLGPVYAVRIYWGDTHNYGVALIHPEMKKESVVVPEGWYPGEVLIGEQEWCDVQFAINNA